MIATPMTVVDEMQDQALLDQLTPIFRDVLDNDELVPVPAMAAADVDGWDSLAHIRLIISIEEALKVRFTADEVAALQNVGDLLVLIKHKRASA
jgi:acyl carrier protein